MCDISAKKKPKVYQRIYGCDISSAVETTRIFFFVVLLSIPCFDGFIHFFFSILFLNELNCRRGRINEFVLIGQNQMHREYCKLDSPTCIICLSEMLLGQDIILVLFYNLKWV